MRGTALLSFAAFAVVTLAAPPGCDFSLVGFGKDNPLGPTTGGKGGKKITVSDEDALVAAVAGTTPATIYVKGKYNLTSRLRIGSNKSVIGAGRGAEITGNGITVQDQTNVIIRNLAIRNILDNDGMTIQNSTRVWVDHNEFSSDMNHGPDYYDGQCDIVRASDWITVSWNYFHDHWKSSLIGNSDALRDVDQGHLHITYHHNHWQHSGTRGPAGRFGHQHVYNNLYEDFLYQAIHSRSDNQVLVEGNVFRGKTREALSTYGLVIPEDSPNTSPDGDWELDGFANLGAST
jgi:pectate lyase